MSYSFKPSVTLEHFLSPSSLLASLFKPQSTYPQFFQTNLVDPQRVIFKFVDCSTNNAVRIFYYQLFRLCFNVKITQLIEPRDYLAELKAVVLDDRFRIKCNQKESVDTQRLNNSMFKPLLKEFFQIFNMENPENFEDIIVKYPILDNIFLNVFKTFLSDFQVLKNFEAQLPTKTIIEELAKIFDLGITKIDQCYRFDEADVFCYIHSDKQLYIALKGKQNKIVNQNKPAIALTNQNKENYDCSNNSTPGKAQKKKHQISTGGVIQEEPSYFSSSSQNSSIFTKESIDKFNGSNSVQIFQSPIQECQISQSSSITAHNSLNNILQGPCYEPISQYQDFTSTLVLELILQPHRQNIRAIKDRTKQRKGLGTAMI